MELYAQRGFDQTTVAEIAQRAGLTERTFFRHFADKREVLFSGAGEMKELLVGTVAREPRSAAPLDAVAAGLAAVAAVLGERRAFARQRQGIIAANAELRERELIKLGSWAAALADTLHERGVAEPAASVAGEVAMAVFRIAFERWVSKTERRGLADLIGESFDELRELAGDSGAHASASIVPIA
jgi:AcrR family transcriptional regulator